MREGAPSGTESFWQQRPTSRNRSAQPLLHPPSPWSSASSIPGPGAARTGQGHISHWKPHSGQVSTLLPLSGLRLRPRALARLSHPQTMRRVSAESSQTCWHVRLLSGFASGRRLTVCTAFMHNTVRRRVSLTSRLPISPSPPRTQMPLIRSTQSPVYPPSPSWLKAAA